MDFLEIKSNALMPSSDITVASSFASVRACNACATHSVPARVVRAYWKGALHRSHDGVDLLGNGATDQPSQNVPSDNPSHPAVWFLQSCHPPHTDGLDHDLRNLAPRQLLPHPMQHENVIRVGQQTKAVSARLSSQMALVLHLSWLNEGSLRICPGPELKSSAGQSSIISPEGSQ